MMGDVAIVVTDSGLGGLSVCAGLERQARVSGHGARTSLTYVNAWPEEGRGYNDYPDMAARAAVFDRVLGAIVSLKPERLLIACNTLSVVYPLTAFGRRASFPVLGIIEAGVSVFLDSLSRSPTSSIVVLGTKTTIASEVHRRALIAAGVDPRRIAAVSCHGLAAAIERDVRGSLVDDLIATCAADVARARPIGDSVLIGLCCTHYAYVAGRLGASVGRALAKPVHTLDPNARLVADAGGMWPGVVPLGGQRPGRVDVISKVVLDVPARDGVAALIRPVSAATADAVRGYRHVPTLF